MRKSLLFVVTLPMFIAGIGLASAQTTTSSTTTWSADQGPVITQYSTSQHYSSYNDPSLSPSVGVALPSNVTVYPLPPTMNVPQADSYSYSIINNTPVVVNRSTRTVVHTWQPN